MGSSDRTQHGPEVFKDLLFPPSTGWALRAIGSQILSDYNHCRVTRLSLGGNTLTWSSSVATVAVILISQRQWGVWKNELLSLPSEKIGKQERGPEALFLSHPDVCSSHLHSMLVNFMSDIAISKSFRVRLWESSLLSFASYKCNHM